MMIEWMALLTPLVTSMDSIALMDSMVALMDLFTVLLASMAFDDCFDGFVGVVETEDRAKSRWKTR